MRFVVLCFLATAACGGDRTATPDCGDPAPPGDADVQTGDATGGDMTTGDLDTSGDSGPGDADAAGDAGTVAAISSSAELCVAGGQIASSLFHGTVCVGRGGPVSTSFSYKWIPGPAHILQAQ